MNPEDTFMAAIIETVMVDGTAQEIEFPRLVMDDWAAWAAQIRAQRRASGEEIIGKEIKNDLMSRVHALRQLYAEEVPMHDAMAQAHTPRGAVKALKISLHKSGKSDEQAEKILASMDPVKQANLALEVCALRMRTLKKDDPPNPPPPVTFGSPEDVTG